MPTHNIIKFRRNAINFEDITLNHQVNSITERLKIECTSNAAVISTENKNNIPTSNSI